MFYFHVQGRRGGGGGRRGGGGGLFGGGAKKKGGGGGGMFGFGGKKKPATKTQTRSASTMPARRPQAKPAPAQAPAGAAAGGGMMGGMAGMVAQGMAFGAGSAIAHRAIGSAADAMSGGDEGEEGSAVNESQQTAAQSGPCGEPKGMLYQCLETQSGSATACQYYFDALRSCQENQQHAQ